MPYSMKEIVQIFNVPEKVIFRWINKRRMPVHQVNYQYSFERSELIEWVTQTRTRFPTRIAFESKTGCSPSISDLLEVGKVFHDILGDSKATVLWEIIHLIPLPKEVDRQHLWELMLARETLGTTELGDGIAIPHVRNPIILPSTKPTISLCYLKKPLCLKSGSQPVSALFTLTSPSIPLHLDILSNLGFILQFQELKDALAHQASHPQLINIVKQLETDLTPSMDN